MFERHSTKKREGDIAIGTEKPGGMTMLKRSYSVKDREKMELEPYWDFEHAPKLGQDEQKQEDRLSERIVESWVEIGLIIALSALLLCLYWQASI